MTLTRDKAIGALRGYLGRLADDEHSVCDVAAQRGIFCRGFTRWGEKQLRQRFHTIETLRPGLPRAQFAELANKWQLARQEVDHLPTACDAQALEHDTCLGWDEFGNDELAQFLHELFGWTVVVV
jgi:hypothetical protein